MNELREGFTTGACAAAAAKAAALRLCGAPDVATVEIPFTDGTRHGFSVAFTRCNTADAEAAVRKYAGDDPDVTDGVTVMATVAFKEGTEIAFFAGEGVGTVTKPGLQVQPGEPAINPAPRRMIQAALREVTEKGANVTIAVPGGRELARKTFNPRLGIKDGISILGTSGRVRPFSVPALRAALACALDIARACGVRCPALVPGNIGERAARRHFRVTAEQVVSVGNEWGFMLDLAAQKGFERILLVGHPGKLAKLAEGYMNTHSSASPAALKLVKLMALKHGIPLFEDMPTVEGIFTNISDRDRKRLGNATALDIRSAVEGRLARPVAVCLVGMNGDLSARLEIYRHGNNET